MKIICEIKLIIIKTCEHVSSYCFSSPCPPTETNIWQPFKDSSAFWSLESRWEIVEPMVENDCFEKGASSKSVDSGPAYTLDTTLSPVNSALVRLVCGPVNSCFSQGSQEVPCPSVPLITCNNLKPDGDPSNSLMTWFQYHSTTDQKQFFPNRDHLKDSTGAHSETYLHPSATLVTSLPAVEWLQTRW